MDSRGASFRTCSPASSGSVQARLVERAGGRAGRRSRIIWFWRPPLVVGLSGGRLTLTTCSGGLRNQTRSRIKWCTMECRFHYNNSNHLILSSDKSVNQPDQSSLPVWLQCQPTNHPLLFQSTFISSMDRSFINDKVSKANIRYDEHAFTELQRYLILSS